MNTNSESTQPLNWKIGDIIEGGYRVNDIIHCAMGRYYILSDDRQRKNLFVKLPTKFALSSSEGLTHFTAEGRLRLEMGAHPNIVSCYFLKQIEDTPCIFLEHMDGGTLREWILEGRCIDYRTNLNLAIQFCHGMEFIHSKGIIHSDLKPENVLMTKEGILKINDFNTARRSPKKNLLIENPLFKKDRLIAGTVGYMSPEHFNDPQNIDERSDIFSFGLCLYEMFCGNTPYDISCGKPQEAPDPVALSKDANFPLDLAKILMKCIQWDPEKRFSSFEEIRDELLIIYSKIFKEESPFAQSKDNIKYLISLGSVLGGYRLHSILGQGGFGFVFKAVNEGHNNFRGLASTCYAIKIASPKIDKSICHRNMKDAKMHNKYDAKGLYFLTGSYGYSSVGWDEIPEVLLQEYSILKKIKNDLFPKVFEYFAEKDHCYYVMEYIAGRELRSVLANESHNNCIHWIKHLRELIVSLSAIEENHNDFYHGDIKPENIIIDCTGRMRLIDPALKRTSSIGLGITLTVQYNPLGLMDVRADTFAIAVIIIEILLNRTPFAHLTFPFMRMWHPIQPHEIESRLKINDLKKALPSAIRDILIDWLIEPRTYKKMLNEWHLLDSIG